MNSITSSKGLRLAPNSCQWQVVNLPSTHLKPKKHPIALGLRRRLPLFTAASFEDSSASSEPPSTEDSPQNEDAFARPFASWAEDSRPGTEQDDWSRDGSLSGPPAKRTLGNVAFVAAISGIAIAAFVLQRQYSLYNRSIARQLPDEKRATSFSVTSMTPLEHSSHSQERAEDDKEEWRRSEDEHEFRQHHIQHNELPEEGNAQFGKSITSENFHEESKADGVFEKEPGHREGGLVTAKYPIRTPEGEAALLRMRDIQKRRIGHWEDQEPIEGAKQHFSEGRDHTSAFDVKYADGWEESQELATPDPDAFDEESSTVNALHDRANTARKAAARAMKAARQAALSSALSAEAAEKAIRAANQASISASKCQSALDLRAEDLIEEAYTAAKQAEEAALSASREASVGSARAEMHRHDAERAAGVAVASADMSQPHGVVETVGAAWRSGRRAFHRSIQQVTSRVRSFSTSVAKDVEKGIHISRQWLTTTSVHIRDGFKSLFGRFSS